MRIDDTLAFLLGDWTIARVLTDHRSVARVTFDGAARLHPQGTSALRARYEERGRMRRGAHEAVASRTLEYLTGEAGTAAVFFSDGRPFFELDLRLGACRVEHRCGDDLYELEFEVCTEDLVRERWRVVGPQKDYDATTTWRRLSGARVGAGCAETCRWEAFGPDAPQVDALLASQTFPEP